MRSLHFDRTRFRQFWKKDYQGALADFDRAIQIDPNIVEVYNYRGNLKGNILQDYQGALVDFNRAIQLKPNYALLYKNRGVLKFVHFWFDYWQRNNCTET